MAISLDLFSDRFWQHVFPLPATSSLRRGHLTPDFELPDITNARTVKLSEFRGASPVVVAFTRIFTEKAYCPLCRPHIVETNANYDRFVEKGVEVLMITSTDLQQSQQVVRDLGLKLPLLSDPAGDVFRAYGVGQALGAPLPAQFVLDRDGKLLYRHLFSFLSPNAETEKLLATC